MQKASKFIEQFWLIFTIASFIYACYAILFTEGWPNGAKNFIITAIALCWWYFRRSMRKRIEKNAAR
jgi:Flp pilus assembly protein TadB